MHENLTNKDLNLVFGNIGTLKKCRLNHDSFGRPLGSALVEYEKPEDAKKAIEDYNGAELEGKVLVVEFNQVKRVPKIRKTGTAITKRIIKK